MDYTRNVFYCANKIRFHVYLHYSTFGFQFYFSALNSKFSFKTEQNKTGIRHRVTILVFAVDSLAASVQFSVINNINNRTLSTSQLHNYNTSATWNGNRRSISPVSHYSPTLFVSNVHGIFGMGAKIHVARAAYSGRGMRRRAHVAATAACLGIWPNAHRSSIVS